MGHSVIMSSNLHSSDTLVHLLQSLKTLPIIGTILDIGGKEKKKVKMKKVYILFKSFTNSFDQSISSH